MTKEKSDWEKIKGGLGKIIGIGFLILWVAGVILGRPAANEDETNTEYKSSSSRIIYYEPCEEEFYECSNICEESYDLFECMGRTGELDGICSFSDCVDSCMSNKGC